MSSDLLKERGKALENIFYKKRDEELLEKLKSSEGDSKKMDTISTLTGVQDKTSLKKIIALGVAPETIAALLYAPFIHVAWADGVVDEAEKKAIITKAKEEHFADKESLISLLCEWLEEKPSVDLKDAWTEYVSALKESISEEEFLEFKIDILNFCQTIAQVAGGVFGFGVVNKSETDVIKAYKEVFNLI